MLFSRTAYFVLCTMKDVIGCGDRTPKMSEFETKVCSPMPFDTSIQHEPILKM